MGSFEKGKCSVDFVPFHRPETPAERLAGIKADADHRSESEKRAAKAQSDIDQEKAARSIGSFDLIVTDQDRDNNREKVACVAAYDPDGFWTAQFEGWKLDFFSPSFDSEKSIESNIVKAIESEVINDLQ